MLSTCNKTKQIQKTCKESANKNPTNESLRVCEFHIYRVGFTRTVTETSVLESVYPCPWHCWKNQKKHTHIEEYYGQRWLDTDSKHEYVSMPEKFITRMWNPHIEQCRAHLCPGCLRPGYFPIDRTDFVYDLNNSKWGVIQNWRRERERETWMR